LGCANCQLGNAPTSVTYNLGSSVAKSLEDPLYYAAKWGGFNDVNGNGTIDSSTEWDALNTDGSAGSDSIPDNYFLVSNPLGLETALNSAFLKILKDSSSSAVATNSSSLNTGTRIYQGRFSNNSWSGQLLSYRLDPVTGSVLSASAPPTLWNLSETPYPEWDSGQKILAQVAAGSDTRLILTNGNGGVGVDFQYANLTSGVGGQQAALDQDALFNIDNCGPERVAFLRGHSSNTGSGSFTCGGNSILRFRARDVSVLGDIINSNPIFVGAPSAGYSDVDHPGYSSFKLTFKDRKPVVYVGANDGMLHGFDTSTMWEDSNLLVDSSGDGNLINDKDVSVPTADSGKEVLGYVPSMVYDNLSRLTDSNYGGNTSASNHRYFVDSSPMVGDVCTASCTTTAAVWKSLLVSGLGAGGKGFFALNVTNPDVAANDTANTPQFSVAQAANIVLWEFKDDADLGFTFNNAPIKLSNGQAKQIAKFENGRWGVVLGNGYNSANGKAVLYVLFVNGPTGSGGAWQSGGVDYVRIEADAAGPNNGLSTPVPFDSDGDGLVDTVYAGDLKGNMWKFDLSSSSAASWTSASLLFVAQDGSSNRQPIINSPEVTLHPTSGNMVLFGTGKFLETTDTISTSVQTFYGVQDTGSTVGGRSALIPQTISTTTVSSVVYRTVTKGCGTTPLPACTSTPKGWYADLPTSGERTTGTPKLVAGNIYFNTFIPSVSPCEFGGTGWLMSMNYLTGALPVPGLFDTNNDGKINDLDTPVSGAQIGAALGGTTLIKGSGTSTTGVGVSSTTEGKTPTTLINFGAGSRGRITWREIVQ
jgi:type IV pilus assembly protein PilY1